MSAPVIAVSTRNRSYNLHPWCFFAGQIRYFSFVPMETDSKLLCDARTMNQEALVKVFDLYSSALYNYALQLCGDRIAADQIVGDVFAKLLEQLSEGNGPHSNLRSYLYEMTYHRVVDEARYSRHRVSLEAISLMQDDARFAALSLEDQIIYKQILYAIQTELTSDQRHVIILRFLEDFSLKETAAILGKAVNHIKVIQNRGLAKLRTSLMYEEIRKPVSSPTVNNLSKALSV